MHEATAIRTVKAAISSCLGGWQEVWVEPQRDRRPLRQWAAAAKIGASGRVLLVRAEGWGPSFERRRMVAHVVIDLANDREAMIRSALNQAAPLIDTQNRTRAVAAAHGISLPIDRPTFVSLDRLSIDLAAARTLRDALRSDEAVVTWLTEQLGVTFDAYFDRRIRPRLRVHGTVLAVPFHLSPVELAADDTRRSRPVWLNDAIRVLMPTERRADDMRREVALLLEETALAGRPIEDSVVWPPAEFQGTPLEIPRTFGPDGRALASGEKEHQWWDVRLQSRLVPVIEAFA